MVLPSKIKVLYFLITDAELSPLLHPKESLELKCFIKLLRNRQLFIAIINLIQET